MKFIPKSSARVPGTPPTDCGVRSTGLALDSNTLTAYAYDNANRLTPLTDADSNEFTFSYDNANRLTSRVLPNGITSTYTYDADRVRLAILQYVT